MSDGLISGSADAGASNGGAAGAANAMNGANGHMTNGGMPNGGDANGRVQQGSNSGGAFDANGDWRSFFSQGLDEDTAKDWGSFSSRIQSPADLAKSYVHAQKEIRNPNKLSLPGQDAKPEDWEKFHQRLAPADPKDYKFPEPEGWELDDEQKGYREQYRPVFKRLGITPWQAEGLAKAEYEAAKLQRDSMVAKAQTVKARTVKALKQQWGEDFDANLRGANTTLAHYAGPEHGPRLAKLVLADGTPLTADPGFLQLLAAVHADRAEDGAMPNALTAQSRQTALEQIATIEKEAADQGITPTDKRYPHQKLEPLYKQAYPQKSGRRQPFGG